MAKRGPDAFEQLTSVEAEKLVWKEIASRARELDIQKGEVKVSNVSFLLAAIQKENLILSFRDNATDEEIDFIDDFAKLIARINENICCAQEVPDVDWEKLHEKLSDFPVAV